MRQKNLPQVTLPDRPIIETKDPFHGRQDRSPYGRLIDEVAQRIGDAEQVAVIGLPDAADAVEKLISRLTIETRKSFSFTTGLSPSIRRSIQAHFYRRPDVARQQTLESQDVRCIHAVPGHPSLAESH